MGRLVYRSEPDTQSFLYFQNTAQQIQTFSLHDTLHLAGSDGCTPSMIDFLMSKHGFGALKRWKAEWKIGGQDVEATTKVLTTAQMTRYMSFETLNANEKTEFLAEIQPENYDYIVGESRRQASNVGVSSADWL
jgi:hypothetical protein